jgi:cytochrome c oxidase subunit II
VAVFKLVLLIAAVVFLVVACGVAYCSLRYRGRGGAGEPRQLFGSIGLEILWTVVPLMIVIGLFVITVRAMVLIDVPQDPASTPVHDLVIIGHQWWWEAQYSPFLVATGDIHIPVGHRMLADIVSRDVIHDFWTPQLARKVDAVPGLNSYIWLEADAPGIYAGTCSEFCGVQHAWMRFRVIADTEPDFRAWLKRQAMPSPAPTGIAVEGERLFQSKKCADCHSVVATESQPGRGPNLAHIATREFLGGGIARNSQASLALWLTDPQSAKPGNRMPATPLSANERDALLAYLESLR